MTIKRFLLLACILAWFGKDGTAQSSTCSINGSFSSATNGSTKDNRLNSTGACINWRLTYQSTGFSALSISIQGAPDSSGTAGTFADITGTTIVVQGSNPSTLLQGEVAIAQFFPWMRVKVNSTTGSGTITYNLNGVNATVVLNRPGSGGGSGSSGVTSFNARTGAVLPASGDYTCADVTNCPTAVYTTVQDEGSSITQRSTINFVGAGVTAADSGGKSTITIPGGVTQAYSTIQDETTPLTQRSTVNFTGAGVSCADDAGNTRTNCTISGGGGGGATVDGYYIKDGSTYYVSPTMQAATLPVAGDFAWVNQGGASEATVGNALVLTVPANSGVSERVRTQSIGANTTLVAAFICNTGSFDFVTCGVGFRESSSGKMVNFRIPNGAQASGAMGGMSVQRMNSATSESTQPLQQALLAANIYWAKLVYNGTNIIFSYSIDGTNYVPVYSEAKNAFFDSAPNQFLYYGATSSTSTPIYVTLLSWVMS